MPAAVAAVALATGRHANAEDADADHAELNERCAIRLAIALQGKSADPAQLTSAEPQAAVDGMLASAEFNERFARFINSEFSGGPAPAATADPVYYLAKYVLETNRPWSELFVGQFAVVATDTAMEVRSDPQGLGYFHSPVWMRRYAGNEGAGYMINASFRIVANTTGLTLTPSVGQPGEDRTADGRQAAACKSCHFDDWFALDRLARLLPKRKGMGDTMTFTPPTEGPQQALGGKTLANDTELVRTLVDSDGFRFNQCRNVFKFLYGRPENQCEAKVFDACVDALVQQKTIKAAVATVAKDPSFCGQ